MKVLREAGEERAAVRVELPAPDPLAPLYVVRDPNRTSDANIARTTDDREIESESGQQEK